MSQIPVVLRWKHWLSSFLGLFLFYQKYNFCQDKDPSSNLDNRWTFSFKLIQETTLTVISCYLCQIESFLIFSAGHTLVSFNSGAASIDLIVPETVSARIRLEQGASSMNIDEKRFPRLTAMSNIYQSADFEKSANQVEIHMEGGVNSVSVR